MIEVSISGISQPAGISRPQVLRMLRDAERGGLIARESANTIRLSALFLERTADILAVNLVSRAIVALRGCEALQGRGQLL